MGFVFVTAVDVCVCAPLPVSTVRFSVATDGTQSNGPSQLPSISSDGLSVAYHSDATNLAQGDDNQRTDVFLTRLDFTAGTLSVVDTRRLPLSRARVSVGLGNTTADIFSDTTIGRMDLMLTPGEHIGREVQIVQGAGNGQIRTITANDATTLTINPPWETVPNAISVFRIIAREDFAATVFTATTIGNAGLTLANDEHTNSVVEILSGTGAGQMRGVTDNDATTLTVDPAWDPVPDATSTFRLWRQGNSNSQRGRISPDGALVAFDTPSPFEEEDDNNTSDVFIHDVASRQLTRVTHATDGGASGAAADVGFFNGDATELVFRSAATDLTIALPPTTADIFTSTTIGNSTLTLTPDSFIDFQVLIVSGTGSGQNRAITDNDATTLTVGTAFSPVPDATSVFEVRDDTNNAPDLFVLDLNTSQITRVSVADDGSQANGTSDVDARLSGGGRLLVFASIASNLVSGDRNDARDIYLRDRQAGTTTRLSLALGGTNPNNESIDPAFSLDGTTVAFSSTATNFVPNDTNNGRDIFLVTTGISDPPVPPPPPAVSVGELPPARQGRPYRARLAASGGTKPLFWAVASGTLPAGLSLDSINGELLGVPRQAGSFRLTVVVMDSRRPTRTAQRTLILRVEE